MIIRSGLIRNRDDIDFASFSEHWRYVHGPLALRVEAIEPIDKIIFLRVCLPGRVTSCTALTEFLNSGLTTSSLCAWPWSRPSSERALRTYGAF